MDDPVPTTTLLPTTPGLPAVTGTTTILDGSIWLLLAVAVIFASVAAVAFMKGKPAYQVALLIGPGLLFLSGAMVGLMSIIFGVLGSITLLYGVSRGVPALKRSLRLWLSRKGASASTQD